MEVCHTICDVDNPAAGPTYSVIGLARAQAELGARVTLHTTGNPSVEDLGGMEIRRHFRSYSQIPMIGNLRHSTSMKRAIKYSSSHVIHTHGIWTLPNTYKNSDAKFVISPRGMLSKTALSFSPIRKFIFGAVVQKRVLESAAMLHATSEDEFRDIRSFGLRQPVALIPNGIVLPLEPSGIKQSPKRTVLFLGRLHPIKALNSLIEAWAKVEPEHCSWHLRIVGPDHGGHALELQKLVQRLKLSRVSIVPPVFGGAKHELLASVDLFVLPSLSENFAMSVAESLAAGVPVIATKGTPWSGLEANGCGWWVDHGPMALSATLRTAMALPDDELRRMGMRGRAWMARDFSWNTMAQMSMQAYAWLRGRGEQPDFVRTK